jgi:hypothetical protein
MGGDINYYQYGMNNPTRNIDPEGKFIVGVAGVAVGAVTGAAGNIAAQLIQNHGNWDCINWRNVGVSSLVGGVSGFFLTFPIGATWSGVAGIGAAGNTASYLLTNPAKTWSLTGAGLAAGSGAVGGIIGGKTPNPFWYGKLSPTSVNVNLASQIVGANSFATNFLGGTVSSLDFSKKGKEEDCHECKK